MSNLYNYSATYLHVKGTITVLNTAADGTNQNNRDKK